MVLRSWRLGDLRSLQPHGADILVHGRLVLSRLQHRIEGLDAAARSLVAVAKPIDIPIGSILSLDALCVLLLR